MEKSEIKKEYFNWLCGLVGNGENYQLLLKCLYAAPFAYIIDRDENRAQDGAELRYRFGVENGVERAVIKSCLDDLPCGVLEMMIALAVRCETHIMNDPDLGDRTGRWFWAMIANLGLSLQFNSNYDPQKVDDILTRFLKREYAPDGEGGLFTVHNCRYDLRKVEIWYQAMWYLDEVLKN